MDGQSIERGTPRKDGMGGHRPQGIWLLEMMLVVNLILVVASIATPIEAVSSQPSAFSEPADS